MKITVQATTTATPEQCWTAATSADAIQQWNAASPEWHCPSAAVDLEVGGKLTSRMEAKDGSMGFELAATFVAIEAPRRLVYRLDDDRMVELTLEPTDAGTQVTQTFDAEEENDEEMQRTGWQAILDSFVRYAEKA